MRTRFIIRGAAGRKGVFMIPIQWKQNDKKTMHVNEAENGVVYLTWPAIEKIEGIRHAFSTRIGGVSKEHLSSMNLSFSRGDDPANVRENYRRFCEAAGFEVENIVTSDQTHTTKVRYVTKADCGSGVTRDRDFHDIDGMITDEPGVVLATFYADCAALLCRPGAPCNWTFTFRLAWNGPQDGTGNARCDARTVWNRSKRCDRGRRPVDLPGLLRGER